MLFKSELLVLFLQLFWEGVQRSHRSVFKALKEKQQKWAWAKPHWSEAHPAWGHLGYVCVLNKWRPRLLSKRSRKRAACLWIMCMLMIYLGTAYGGWLKKGHPSGSEMGLPTECHCQLGLQDSVLSCWCCCLPSAFKANTRMQKLAASVLGLLQTFLYHLAKETRPKKDGMLLCHIDSQMFFCRKVCSFHARRPSPPTECQRDGEMSSLITGCQVCCS